MLSINAKMLACELWAHRKSNDLDRTKLTEIWTGQDEDALRPAIDELERNGFIAVERVIGLSHEGIPDKFKLRDIAGVQMLEPLERFCNNLELA